MFDHLIIDLIIKKEKERQENYERPFLELPLPPEPLPQEVIEEKPETKRVIVIDLNDP